MRRSLTIFFLPLILLTVLTALLVGGCSPFGKQIVVKAFVDDGEQIVTKIPAHDGMSLTITFIHSVQKTPVEEFLELDGDAFVLKRTRYKSQGVGLPFMESDGSFHREGEWLVMDDMNRRIENLSLRTGVGTRLTIMIGDEVIELFEMFEPGTRVDLIIN